MKIFRQPASGKMALLGDQMVASLGNHRMLVGFRLAVVTPHATIFGRCKQEGSQVSKEVTKGEECTDHGVIVGNEMEDAAPGWIRVPWQREQQHVGSLAPCTHGRQRRQEQIATRKTRVKGGYLSMIRQTHLVKPGRNKTCQDLTVAEDQDAGDCRVRGKDLSLLLPLQLGAEDDVGAILQVGQTAGQSVKRRPEYREEKNCPAKSRRGPPLRWGLLLGGVRERVGGCFDVQDSP